MRYLLSIPAAVSFGAKHTAIKMRVITTVALTATVVVVMLLRCCDGASLRFSLPEDEEEYRPRPMYRDYGLIRSRVLRADDGFDDYGHLRFGRSDD